MEKFKKLEVEMQHPMIRFATLISDRTEVIDEEEGFIKRTLVYRSAVNNMIVLQSSIEAGDETVNGIVIPQESIREILVGFGEGDQG